MSAAVFRQLQAIQTERDRLVQEIDEKTESKDTFDNSLKTREEVVHRLEDRNKVILEEIGKRQEILKGLKKKHEKLTQQKTPGPVAPVGPTTAEEDVSALDNGPDISDTFSLEKGFAQLKAELRKLQKDMQRGRQKGEKTEPGEEHSDDFDHIKISCLRAIPLLGTEEERDKLSETGTFRLTPEYTFKMLLEDACLYFGVFGAIEGATLRDSNDKLWTLHERVQEQLTAKMEKMLAAGNEGMPQIRLTLPDSKVESKGPSTKETSLGTNVMDEEEYYKAAMCEKRARMNREAFFMDLATKTTPFVHDDINIGHEFIELYKSSATDQGYTEEAEAEFKFEIQTRMAADFVSMILHSFFVLALVYPLIYARGNLVPQSDMQQALLQRFHRSTTTAPSVDGSYASSVNANTLQTLEQIKDWLIGPALFVFFQDEGGLPTPIPDPNNALLGADISNGEYILLGDLEVSQYRSEYIDLTSTATTATCNYLFADSPVLKNYQLMAYDSTAKTWRDGSSSVTPSMIKCFDQFDTINQERKSYSRPTNPQNPHADYNFTFDSTYGAQSVVTEEALYASKAYLEHLGDTYNNTRASLRRLFQNGYIDLQTRALVMRGNMYNVNYGLIVAAQIVLEILPSGAVIASPQFHYLRLNDYGTSLVVLTDLYVFMYAFALLYVAIAKIRMHGPLRFFSVSWNILDVLLVAGCFYRGVVIKSEAHYEVIWKEINSEHYNDAATTVSAEQYNTTLVACILVCAGMLRTIKFLQRNRQIERMWRALVLVFPHVITLGFLFIIYITAFSLSCYIRCGWKMKEFSTVVFSYLVIMREFLGGYSNQEGKSLNWIVRENFPLFAQYVRANIFFMKYCLLYLFTAVFLAGFVQVLKENRNFMEQKQASKAWDPSRVQNGQFWSWFMFGRCVSKRPYERPGSASILPIGEKPQI